MENIKFGCEKPKGGSCNIFLQLKLDETLGVIVTTKENKNLFGCTQLRNIL